MCGVFLSYVSPPIFNNTTESLLLVGMSGCPETWPEAIDQNLQ